MDDTSHRSFWGAAAMAVLALLVFCSAFFRINAPDFWWHLANGRYMLEHHTLHFSDPFSYTTDGASYPPTQWAFEITALLLYRFFGPAGPIVTKALLLTGLFVGLGRLLRREGSSLAVTLLLLLVGLHLARFRFILRPDLVTYAGLGAIVYFLRELRDGNARRLRLMPLLFLFWIQFHSGAIFGLLVLGATWLGEVLAARFLPGSAALDGRQRKALLRWTLLSFAATLFNPNHVKYIPFALGHMADYEKLSIAELRPLEWAKDRHRLVYMVFACAALLRVWRRNPSALLVLLPLAYAAFRTVRLFPVFLILSIPIVAEAVGSFRIESRLRGARAVLGIAAAAFALWTAFALRPGRSNDYYSFGVGINGQMAPVAAADALERIDPGGHLFNSNMYGGYLIWRFGGERKVFTDGRSQIHEKTLEFIRTHSWPEIIERYGIGHCLIDYYWYRPKLPSGKEMVLVWWDDLSILLVSRGEAERRGLPFYSQMYPVVSPDAIRRTVDPGTAERELRRAVDEALHAVLPRLVLSIVLGWKGDWEGAERLLSEAVSVEPWREELRVNHGVILAKLGRNEEAIRELKKGLRSEKKNAEAWTVLGKLLLEKGDARGAGRALSRAAELSPERSD
ncbi:MAG: tetratricopeptide repeat protein [Candidatus Eisenbacteria bacterium]